MILLCHSGKNSAKTAYRSLVLAYLSTKQTSYSFFVCVQNVCVAVDILFTKTT